VRLVEPPEPLPEIEPVFELPPPPIQPPRKPKRRLDPPHHTTRWAAIRRGWNAEEFVGELDDQINPLWLQDENPLDIEEPREELPAPRAKANPPMRIIHPRFGSRTFKLLTEDDDESPVIVEISEDDLEADNKLA
jgi:hypothetical protein